MRSHVSTKPVAALKKPHPLLAFSWQRLIGTLNQSDNSEVKPKLTPANCSQASIKPTARLKLVTNSSYYYKRSSTHKMDSQLARGILRSLTLLASSISPTLWKHYIRILERAKRNAHAPRA